MRRTGIRRRCLDQTVSARGAKVAGIRFSFFPQPGKDVPGAVFAIQHESTKAIWLNTAMDNEARHFQYVYFLPGTLVTTIDVAFDLIDDRNTKVSVVYTRTALDAAANDHVGTLGEHDSKSGKYREEAIDDYLRTRKR